jgi:5-formyltetrahydrofolate cyclo-ligase
MERRPHSSEIADAKRVLRAELRARRARDVTLLSHTRLSGQCRDQIAAADPLGRQLAAVLDQCVADWPGPIAAFYSLPTEPNTQSWLLRRRQLGLPVLLPCWQPDGDLDWAVDDGIYRRGAGPGVCEPTGPRRGLGAIAEPSIIFVPALAVDPAGHRLGHGGGSYDRALTRVQPGAWIVAVIHPSEFIGKVPHDTHDQRVHAVATTDGLTQLRSAARDQL